MTSRENKTVILVHGAWADGSSWSEVIGPLVKEGLQVVAAPLPLSSLSDDAAALQRTLARTAGPVILAGHAYAGAVIATANDERVRGLVYIAALAPAKGETVAQVFYRDTAHPMAPQLAPDEGFSNRFCASRNGRSDCASQGGTAAHFCQMHSRDGGRACLEQQTFLVSDCRGRSHDQS
jgi:pimeloyl-ACP methyl ester carboxylesterase